MESIKLPIILLDHYIEKDLPFYATKGSVGLDLIAAIDKDINIKPLQRVLVPNGFKIELPIGYEAQIRPRSGLAFKNGITVLNSPGTIDSDYRGEIKTLLVNLSQDDFVITPGMRISQMIIANFTRVELILTTTIKDSDRGEGGFGSTGS